MRWLVNAEGVVEQPSAEQIAACMGAEREGVSWLDIEDPQGEDLQILKDGFRFHNLTLEDVRHRTRSPKIDDYAGYVFLALTQMDWQPPKLTRRDEHIFLSRHYIVTVHSQPDRGLRALHKRVKEGPELAREKPAFLQFLVLNRLAEHTFAVLEGLEVSITALERKIISRPSRREMAAVYDLRQAVTDLAKYLGAQREIFQHLITHSIEPDDHQQLVYYKDVHERLARQHEAAESLRDLCHSVVDVYMAGADNRLNETMKQLTIVAALFLPVTAISGFFGMNHQFLVEHITGPNVFWATVGAMLMTQLLLGVFFWRRGYF
jgi:magnesium transporter